MNKSYTISIVISGDQGPVMRREYRMPVTMLDTIGRVFQLSQEYPAVAEALTIGPVSITTLCSTTGLDEDDARTLLRAAGAKVVKEGGVTGKEFWGFE